MICKKCNAEIPNDSAFCPECGAPCEVEEVKAAEVETAEVETAEVETAEVETEEVVETIEETVAETEPVVEEAVPAAVEPVKVEVPAKKKKNAGNIVGMVIGVICMAFGILSFLTATHGLNTASFGADFYTYTYDGIYAAAQLLQTVAKVCSLLLTAAGYCMVYFFSKKNK